MVVELSRLIANYAVARERYIQTGTDAAFCSMRNTGDTLMNFVVVHYPSLGHRIILAVK